MTRRLLALVLLGVAALLGFAGTAAATGTGQGSTPTLAGANSNPVATADNAGCLSCHAADAHKGISVKVEGQAKSGAVDGKLYAASRHGRLACTSCHLGFKQGPHTAEQTKDWLQTAKITACANCHADQFTMYRGSFHGNLVFKQSDGRAPVCADCHVAHNILPPETAAFRAAIPALCARCHAHERKTYMDSYHGKATYLGDAKTAVCTDCHGGHRILPASDPRSSISKGHLVKTCAGCHPGANKNFAEFMVHVDPNNPKSSWIVFTFNVLYILLITVVFTFGAVHSGLYIYRGIKDGLYARSHS